jgi:predicted helicase
MTIKEYVEIVSKRLQSGISREHSYRGDLETLIRELVKGIEITNEPANVTDCGNPDYVITKGKIPVGYIEAKDIGKDLNSKSYKEQFGRYKKALDNLIITDYIWFQFFQHGELVHEIKIGEIENNSVKPIPENFSKFENLIKDFSTHIGQTIKSSKKLAEMMAGKARLLQDILERAITSDEETQENTSLKGQYDTFKQILIHDLKPKDFADIYAQTLAYGMFAARLHDPTLDDFSRQEAAELIPKSNPFLRKLFGYIAGPDIDERIVTVVDNLAEVFRATNVEQLLKNFGKATQMHDPIIHFYETFLAEYDSKLRKARGVWYTPEPVVNFIVRAVDDILKTEFDLAQGLADTSKTKIKLDTQTPDKRSTTGYKQIEKEVHKVQILDPATGTGTFLAEVVKFIYNKNFKAMKGAWSGYVEEHLIPRLNGFELLMASYAMAHLKLDMLLTETGFKPTKNQRLNVYLTNSLEEHHKDTGTLFSNWLSSEANEANHIKRDTPVMCVIGNPPYSISSYNQSNYIDDLMELYRIDVKDEKNIQLLSDDYAKFIRYCHSRIEQSGYGTIGLITKNTYLNVTAFKGMRIKLLEYFDKIYILNLHGKMYEKCSDGTPNENVFDIRVGTAIMFLVKNNTKPKNKLGKLFVKELNGLRDFKYNYLTENNLKSIDWEELEIDNKYFFFENKNFINSDIYNTGFSVDDIFKINNSGVETGRDHFILADTKIELENRLNNFINEEISINDIRTKYNLKDQPKFKLELVHNSFKTVVKNKLDKYSHKPFYNRFVYYDKLLLRRHSEKVMSHFLNIKENTSLVLKKRFTDDNYHHCFCTNSITDRNFLSGQTYVFPLYIYPKQKDGIFSKNERTPNLNQEIVNKIAEKLGLTFTNEKEETKGTFAPIDILDYIYAVLHSPTYRDKYKEFLKIDFPRISYPKNVKTFWNLVQLGKEVRQIHLLESNKVEDYITSYEMAEDAENDHNVITTKIGKKDWEIIDTEKQLGRIWINESKYFNNVPVTAWEFYIGGYQPAQKWLKDRKERELKFEDILHYQKIIVALTETDRIMKEIDKIEIE